MDFCKEISYVAISCMTVLQDELQYIVLTMVKVVLTSLRWNGMDMNDVISTDAVMLVQQAKEEEAINLSKCGRLTEEIELWHITFTKTNVHKQNMLDTMSHETLQSR